MAMMSMMAQSGISALAQQGPAKEVAGQGH